jgi:hypothetical protein
LVTIDTAVPDVQANCVELLHTAGVPQDWLLRPTVAPSDAQVVGCHPVCSVQVRVWFPHEQVPHAVTLAGTGQAAFARVQVTSFVPPLAPRHDQVDDPPQDPAIFALVVPSKQAN